MYCRNCGAKLEENQNYCAVCGTKVVHLNDVDFQSDNFNDISQNLETENLEENLETENLEENLETENLENKNFENSNNLEVSEIQKALDNQKKAEAHKAIERNEISKSQEVENNEILENCNAKESVEKIENFETQKVENIETLGDCAGQETNLKKIEQDAVSEIINNKNDSIFYNDNVNQSNNLNNNDVNMNPSKNTKQEWYCSNLGNDKANKKIKTVSVLDIILLVIYSIATLIALASTVVMSVGESLLGQMTAEIDWSKLGISSTMFKDFYTTFLIFDLCALIIIIALLVSSIFICVYTNRLKRNPFPYNWELGVSNITKAKIWSIVLFVEIILNIVFTEYADFEIYRMSANMGNSQTLGSFPIVIPLIHLIFGICILAKICKVKKSIELK